MASDRSRELSESRRSGGMGRIRGRHAVGDADVLVAPRDQEHKAANFPDTCLERGTNGSVSPYECCTRAVVVPYPGR